MVGVGGSEWYLWALIKRLSVCVCVWWFRIISVGFKRLSVCVCVCVGGFRMVSVGFNKKAECVCVCVCVFG